MELKEPRESKRPKSVRKPGWSVELIEAVRKLREEFRASGKVKLVILVRKQGFQVSESTAGRILAYLKRRGVLREPVKKVKARTTPMKRDYATRKPPDYEVVKKPGDLVQTDTCDRRQATRLPDLSGSPILTHKTFGQ